MVRMQIICTELGILYGTKIKSIFIYSFSIQSCSLIVKYRTTQRVSEGVHTGYNQHLHAQHL